GLCSRMKTKPQQPVAYCPFHETKVPWAILDMLLTPQNALIASNSVQDLRIPLEKFLNDSNPKTLTTLAKTLQPEMTVTPNPRRSTVEGAMRTKLSMSSDSSH